MIDFVPGEIRRNTVALIFRVALCVAVVAAALGGFAVWLAFR